MSPIAGNFEFKNLNIISNNGYSLKLGSWNSNVGLFSLLFRGAIKINYLNLKDANIHITQNASTEEKEGEEVLIDISSLPILDIDNAKINNLSFTYKIKRTIKEESSLIEFSSCNITIPKLKTGGNGTIIYKGTFKISKFLQKDDDTSKSNGGLEGKIYANIDNNSVPSLVKLTSEIKIGEEITPIEITFESKEHIKSQRYPFHMDIKTSNFPLLPIFKAFVEDSSSESTGRIKNLSFNMNGSDLGNPDISTNVNGSIKTYIRNLSLPTSLAKFKIFRIIFLPIEILAHITDYTTSKAMPSELNNIFKANNLTNGINNMHFKKTNINISLKKGKIQFKKLKMQSGLLSAIQSISIKGYLDLGRQMDIDTKINFSGLVIPLNIQGTIDDPKPTLETLSSGMIVHTIKNIIGKGVDIGNNIADTITPEDEDDYDSEETDADETTDIH